MTLICRGGLRCIKESGTLTGKMGNRATFVLVDPVTFITLDHCNVKYFT